MNWYTSDTHFGHVNIVEFCKRPFKDVDEMNETLIERWNARVRPGDVIYHLGDFSMYLKREEQRAIMQRLNGYKVLVRGNHDSTKARMLDIGFNEVVDETVITDGDGSFLLYLRHKPKEDFAPLPRDTLDWVGHSSHLHLCGHVHEKWRRQEAIINVGVDQWAMQPQSIYELAFALA